MHKATHYVSFWRCTLHIMSSIALFFSQHLCPEAPAATAPLIAQQQQQQVDHLQKRQAVQSLADDTTQQDRLYQLRP